MIYLTDHDARPAGVRFRELMARPQILQMPGAHNGLAARQAAQSGFEALYLSGAALSMDDIMARLAISRGNVSMNLSKLVEWGLVRRVHRRGDRREYYESLSDVWEVFTLVAAQRKRREIDPILTTLRRCRQARCRSSGRAARR